MLSLLINVDSPTNPLRSVLLPRAVMSPVLKDALAALHVSIGEANTRFRTVSLAYYDRALSGFQIASSRCRKLLIDLIWRSFC